MKQIKLMTEKMLLETNGPVSWITFNQPEKRNAISLAMWEGLAEALALSMEDESIKVITKSGKAYPAHFFCTDGRTKHA